MLDSDGLFARQLPIALSCFSHIAVHGFCRRRFDLLAIVRFAVRRFSSRLRGAKVGLFYYAGHGLQVHGKNYLAPIDARLADQADLHFETIPLGIVLDQMEREKCVNLVFLDACRDNPLTRNLARSMGPGRSAAVGRGLSPE